MNIKNSIIELIGNTPLIKIESLSKKYNANIYGKCEFLNPTSSVKDRPAYFMIKDALEKKLIDKNSTIIEPTSGNTGIALAAICAKLKIDLILTMPESMSIERRKLLKFLGAKIELTPANLGMKGAVDRAYELLEKIPNSFMPNQFENKNNPKSHKMTTALEILKDLDNKIDCFVAGVGTGGSISGIGEVLKERVKDVKIYAVEPKKSPVLSGGSPGAHKIQGIGAGFVPKILNMKIIGEIILIDDEEAFEMSRFLAKEEGLLVGISSGANVAASCKIAQKNPGKNIVTLLCDTAERYLSTELFS